MVCSVWRRGAHKCVWRDNGATVASVVVLVGSAACLKYGRIWQHKLKLATWDQIRHLLWPGPSLLGHWYYLNWWRFSTMPFPPSDLKTIFVGYLNKPWGLPCSGVIIMPSSIEVEARVMQESWWEVGKVKWVLVEKATNIGLNAKSLPYVLVCGVQVNFCPNLPWILVGTLTEYYPILY